VRAASTIYVGSGPGNDTGSIFDAIINKASPGDTVFVYSGVYFEALWIDKSINLIGEDMHSTIIDGNGGRVFMISSAHGVNISGFTIKHGERSIYITSSSNISIKGNKIYNNTENAIECLYSSNITIFGNEIYNNTANGIRPYYSSNIKVQENNIYDNVNGIWTTYSSNNTFINNTVHDNRKSSQSTGFFFSGSPYTNNKIEGNFVFNNTGDGIHLEDETGIDGIVFWNNTIINNTVYNNDGDGITIAAEGNNNFIVGNTVHHNGLGAINPKGGIAIRSVCNNIIIDNIMHDNQIGILANKHFSNHPSMNNTFIGNTIYQNEYGIRLIDSPDNLFYENSISDNTFSVHISQRSSFNEFINCTLTNATNNVYIEGESRRIKFTNCSLSNPSEYDFNLTHDSYVILLNTTFNKTRVYYGDIYSDMLVQWYMHVSVIYYNTTPVSYAQIWVNDTFFDNIRTGPSDSQGWTRWLNVTEYTEQDINGDHIGDKFYFTPHIVTGTDGTLWGVEDPYMNISKVVLIILGTPPPILPPTNLTTKVVNNGDNVKLKWEPSNSFILDHYLIYRADSATDFDFTIPYNISTTWPNPKDFTWVDPDPNVTAIDDDFYYIVRAANANESDVSTTSNTAGVWTRTFSPGTSTFSLPLEPYINQNIELFRQDMNASYIKWMHPGLHKWMKHGDGGVNDTQLMQGEGYEVKFATQTTYTFCGMPGAMILYDEDILFSGFNPESEAKNVTASVDVSGNIKLTWQEPASMGFGDWYEVYYSNTRDGFFGTLGIDYDLACPAVSFGTNTTTILGLGANDPGARIYLLIVPFNSFGIKGASTYSIGVWTKEYLTGYDTIGIPLKLSTSYTANWYCDNIPDTVGINYFIYSGQRWGWHSTRMPGGAYDPILYMIEGYQISTSSTTKYTFIGV
jgi:parallel beta-helix repeat protein